MKTYEEVASLIWTAPDELNEEELEGYLQVAEVQANLDRDNFLALAAMGHYIEDNAA